MSETTEDSCAFCHSSVAPLGVQFTLMARNPTIETMIHPACEECYVHCVESGNPRVVLDHIPSTFTRADGFTFVHKTWSRADYDRSWEDDDSNDEGNDDEPA